MASDLERIARAILGISRPGGPEFLSGRDAWEEKVRGLLGEAFLLGAASAERRDQEKAVYLQQNGITEGRS